MKDYGTFLKKVYEHYGLPSLAVGVCDHGEISYYFYGVDDSKGAAPDEKTRYMIGSASKCFISTSVCRLASEGKIDLDAPVTRYLPEFAFYNEERTEKITVRMILSHQTGLPRHDVSWVNNTEGMLDDTVANIRYLQPAFGIGERFYYQNHMFALASKLVETVARMPWQEYVKQHILEPLGMERTWTDTHAFGAEGSGCVRPYAKAGGRNVPWQIWPSDNMGCAAVMTSTVEDELRWMTANLYGGTLEGRQIFDAWADDQLHSPQMPIREHEMYGYPMADVGITSSAYGLGWFLETQDGERVIHHGGTVGGFRSECGYAPEQDLAFVVFANLDNTQAVCAAQRGILDIARGREPKDWCALYDAASEKAKARARKAIEPLLASVDGDLYNPACDGIYHHPAYGSVRVSSGEDRTTRIWFLGQPLKMKVIGEDLLLIDALDLANIAAPCRFIREDGRVTGLAAMLEPEIRDFICFRATDRR